jgi:hypothetical protein
MAHFKGRGGGETKIAFLRITEYIKRGTLENEELRNRIQTDKLQEDLGTNRIQQFSCVE